MIGKTISHYKILGQVGEGGMGVVYVAEDTVLGRRVAIKIPHAGREENHYRSRFLREARAVSKLRHPNIAAVYDYGETSDGQPYIVMELVGGQTLGDLLAGPGISLARAVEVTEQVAEALSEAHRRGVVHRDIKPSNVIVDEGGEVKVLDFGLAKQLHEEYGSGADSEARTMLSARTRSDVVIGTPLYLSPEQARGAKVDGRSDLFALGALLYECVAGRPAFSGANVIEIGAQVLHYDPPPPSRFNPRVPAELDRLTLKALAKKPEERFQSADEFAAELERVRARLPHSDTVRTRRIAVAGGNGSRSTALLTMADGLRRPKFSPLTLLAALAALGLLIWGVAYARRPKVYVPSPETLARYEQGVDAMRAGSYYKASVLLAQAVEREPKFALARARYAEALMEMDFLDRATGEMFQAASLTPDSSIYPRADALYLDAVGSTIRREYAAATNYYEEVVKLDPDRPQSYLDLGRAYERDNQIRKAINNYAEAAGRDAGYAAAFLRLGALHVRVNNQAAATAAFDSAQKLYEAAGDKEGQAAVQYQRGRLFVNLGKPAEARASLGRALALAQEAENKYQQVQALQQLALLQDDGEEGQRLARRAYELAQATGMNDLAANGFIVLGNVLFVRLGKYEEAERNYDLALQYARNNKLKRYEALALFSKASLRDKQGKPDEAEALAQQAREFFRVNGYRREADQSLMLIARSRKRRGDHQGALAVFEELLRSAEQAGDTGQVGSLHRECGAVFSAQEKYAEAFDHYKESAAAARTLHNQNMLTYATLNQANALWPLGRYREAGDLFGQLTDADPQTLGVGRDVVASAYHDMADMELSRRDFAAAGAKLRQALALLKEGGGQTGVLFSYVNADLGLVEVAQGARGRGKALCEETARSAAAGNDPWIASHTQYVLALALLEAGDAAGARAAAERALDIYARAGRPDSEWRALALAGKASRRAGDENAARDYLSRAATSLSQLEQRLGAEAQTYLLRPDVQWLRSEFAPAGAPR